MLQSEEQISPSVEQSLPTEQVVAKVKELLPQAYEALLKNRKGLHVTQFAMDPQVTVSTYRDNDARIVGETTVVEDRDGNQILKRVVFQDGEGRMELGYGTVKIQDPTSRTSVRVEQGVLSYMGNGEERGSINSIQTVQNIQNKISAMSSTRVR